MSLLKKLCAITSTAMLVIPGFAVPLAVRAADAPPGALVKDSSGTIYFITDKNQRRPFTSAGALDTYGFLSLDQVVGAGAYSNFFSLPTGSFIPPRDGSIFCASETKGTDVAGECALITSGMKASFTSAAVFTGLGFSFSRAKYGDSSFLAKTSNIDNVNSAHRQGVLITYNGTVYLVGPSNLLGIPSVADFNSWGYSFADAVPANAADGLLPQTANLISRIPGQLNPVSVSTNPPTVQTKNATGILATSAYLSGTVFPNEKTTTYWFEYGTTTNLGSKTPDTSISADTASKNAFNQISSLTGGTKYYYRLVAESESGKTLGETLSFTTQ